MSALEAVDFDGLLVETQAVVLVREELLDLVALIALELDHVAHALGVGVVDDGAIAGCSTRLAPWLKRKGGTIRCPKEGVMSLTEVLLDDLENLLVVKLLRNALDGGQGLTTITLCSNQLAGRFTKRDATSRR
jgi:hypothetical protein